VTEVIGGVFRTRSRDDWAKLFEGTDAFVVGRAEWFGQ
jgi:hypothetical protein